MDTDVILVLLAISVSVLGVLGSTYLLMLLIGALHNDVVPALPSLGYWQTFLVTLALGVVGAIIRGVSR